MPHLFLLRHVLLFVAANQNRTNPSYVRVPTLFTNPFKILSYTPIQNNVFSNVK